MWTATQQNAYDFLIAGEPYEVEQLSLRSSKASAPCKSVDIGYGFHHGIFLRSTPTLLSNFEVREQ